MRTESRRHRLDALSLTWQQQTFAVVLQRPVSIWSRTKGWYVVRAVMKSAKIAGAHATPKGLRHGFGIKAVTCGVPLNTLQQLFGHAQLSTTSI
jgi:site-specific recombinase XerD